MILRCPSAVNKVETFRDSHDLQYLRTHTTVTGKRAKPVKREPGLVGDIRRLADEETPEANDSLSVALGQFESRLPQPPPPPPKRPRRTQRPCHRVSATVTAIISNRVLPRGSQGVGPLLTAKPEVAWVADDDDD